MVHSREEIIFALLYGSIADPMGPEMYGDIDLAIYVRAEFLDTPEYILESKIEAEAYRRLSRQELGILPIEVLVINKAPYPFLVRLFRGKYIVIKEDEETLTDFIEEVGVRSMANSHLRFESLQELLEDHGSIG